MYCKHCGKELSDEALMCPNCGAPTGARSNIRKPSAPSDGQTSPLGAIALFLSIFSFVTGIIFGSFFYAYAASVILLYFISATSILPGLAAVCLGIAILHRREGGRGWVFAIVSIVAAGIALFFLFIAACVTASVVL